MRVVALVAAITVAACTQRAPEAAPTNATTVSDAIVAAAAAPTGDANGGTPFDVPSDANARYALLRVEKGEGGRIIATTRREGSSGTSFARREIDCTALTFRYVGEGDTLDQANQPAPNPGEMADLVEGAISDVASKFACADQ